MAIWVGYMAPELILRKSEYGAAIDIWASACLLAEAVLGQRLFSAESEIQLLFEVFKLLGTPNRSLWPEALSCKSFSALFPVYKPFELREQGEELRKQLGDSTLGERHPFSL